MGQSHGECCFYASPSQTLWTVKNQTRCPADPPSPREKEEPPPELKQIQRPTPETPWTGQREAAHSIPSGGGSGGGIQVLFLRSAGHLLLPSGPAGPINLGPSETEVVTHGSSGSPKWDSVGHIWHPAPAKGVQKGVAWRDWHLSSKAPSCPGPGVSTEPHFPQTQMFPGGIVCRLPPHPIWFPCSTPPSPSPWSASSPTRRPGGHQPSDCHFPAGGPPSEPPSSALPHPPLLILLILPGRKGRGQGAKAWLVLPGGGKRLEMGAPPRPCQLLLLLGVFLLLLYLSSRHLPKLSLAACVRGRHRCPWLGETLPKEEEPGPASAPAGTPTPPLPLWGEEFDIRQLRRAFSTSLSPRGEILLREYLHGWRQLLKFMDALGTAFGLISRETESKISIMQQHQEGPHSLHYHTVQSMVKFELASGLVGFQSLPAHQPPSGCRTLLRLHRALKWLELFLHKLGTSQKDEKSSRMCAEAYRVALAPYHSWWVQQAVALAFLAMPSRQELYHIIVRGEKPAAGAIVLTTVESLSRVYNVTQEVYSAHGMLELP